MRHISVSLMDRLNEYECLHLYFLLPVCLCMYVVRTYVSLRVCTYVYMYVCMLCMYVVYVMLCIYVCMYVFINISINPFPYASICLIIKLPAHLPIFIYRYTSIFCDKYRKYVNKNADFYKARGIFDRFQY